MTPVEFREYLWYQKARLRGLLCDTVTAVLRLAVLVEHITCDTDTTAYTALA